MFYVQAAIAGVIGIALVVLYRHLWGGFFRFAVTYGGLTLILIVLYGFVFGLMGVGLRDPGVPVLERSLLDEARLPAAPATLLLALIGVIAY